MKWPRQRMARRSRSPQLSWRHLLPSPRRRHARREFSQWACTRTRASSRRRRSCRFAAPHCATPHSSGPRSSALLPPLHGALSRFRALATSFHRPSPTPHPAPRRRPAIALRSETVPRLMRTPMVTPSLLPTRRLLQVNLEQTSPPAVLRTPSVTLLKAQLLPTPLSSPPLPPPPPPPLPPPPPPPPRPMGNLLDPRARPTSRRSTSRRARR